MNMKCSLVTLLFHYTYLGDSTYSGDSGSTTLYGRPSSHFLTGYNSSRSCTGCLNVLAILLIIILLFYSQPVIARTACLPMFLSAVSPLLSFCVLLHERTLRSPPKLYRNFLLHMWMTLCCLTLREYLGIYYVAHSISHVKVYYRF